ncbi:hypothetical protein AB0G60_13385 [Streptomyces angustmyceticus]|uniref:Uncharacterized protein n=1 Tax=Streptomyces angustmyceticus TaxID=285578 RepID=A0A5J4LA84_9ACTN|nr:hypothetical protein [Streptomyces angustmyceticus]UAL67497.1 hypothetical protein K7396_13890 [Streptomyces angustmyceticus]GES31247.1 hypothetical protein San01_37340 [Streptomyces angustmyceticus]
MPYDARTPAPPEAPDVVQVLKANYRALIGLFALRLLITALLVAIPVALSRATGSNSVILTVPIVPGVFLFIYTVYRFAHGLRVFQCARVLRAYPMVFHPRVVKKSERRTRYGNVFEIRVTTRGQHGAPLMLAVNATGRRRWPQSTEAGVWLAGDLPFGGVMVMPGGKEMFFLKPADWDKTARGRDEAGPERLARAQQAKLTDRTKHAVMMRSGA